MARHNPEVFTFLKGMQRARILVGIHKYSIEKFPEALDCTDILRSSIILAMSSLDLLVHSTVKREILYRYEKRISVKNISVPFNLFVSQSSEILCLLDNHFLESHGYKSFISPEKISEILSCFMDRPWEKISENMNINKEAVKAELKALVKWRNRIAHEQDINPRLGGTALWPILSGDVERALDFLDVLGPAIGKAMSESI